MTTIDRNGALHAGDGKYSSKPQSAAEFDLDATLGSGQQSDGAAGRDLDAKPTVGLSVRDFEGEYGNKSHITRIEEGSAPTEWLASLPGVRGEEPGQHRNRGDAEWDAFKRDVAERGIVNPIFVTVDVGVGPRISEGNHRRDAAVELGLETVPVQVRYYGHAERDYALDGPTGEDSTAS